MVSKIKNKPSPKHKGQKASQIKNEEAAEKRKKELRSREARISHAPWWKRDRVEKEIQQEATKGMKFHSLPGTPKGSGKKDEKYYKKQAEWDEHLAEMSKDDRENAKFKKGHGRLDRTEKQKEAERAEFLKHVPKMEKFLARMKQKANDLQQMTKKVENLKNPKKIKAMKKRISKRRLELERLEKQKLSFDDAQRLHSFRSHQARVQDEEKTGKIVDDFRWVYYPNRYDYRDVDTPRRLRNDYIRKDAHKETLGIFSKIKDKATKRHEYRVKLQRQVDGLRMRQQELEIHDPYYKPFKTQQDRAKAEAKHTQELVSIKQRLLKLYDKTSTAAQRDDRISHKETMELSRYQRRVDEEEQRAKK